MIFPYIFMEKFAGYENQWLALHPSDNHIVGSGATLQEAGDKARQQGYRDPVFFKVPPSGYFISTPFC
jgi:hypothetical protein